MEHAFHRTDLFNPRDFHRGKSFGVFLIWILVRIVFFQSSVPWPSTLKTLILRLFGARVGKSLYMRPRVYIHFPWNLTLGDHCWIGERCEIYNFEMVSLDDYAALAHDVFIAAASHDIRSLSMRYKNLPVRIGKGVWIASRVFIQGGVFIGDGAVVGAGCIVSKNVEPLSILKTPEPVIFARRVIDRP